MTKLPKTISIVEAAKALNCATGTITQKLGIVPITGKEQIRLDKLAETFNCPPQFLADVLLSNDRAVTRQQAAEMLGVKPHSLNIVNKRRATILPLVWLGHGPGAGTRYSRKAIEAHLSLVPA